MIKVINSIGLGVHTDAYPITSHSRLERRSTIQKLAMELCTEPKKTLPKKKTFPSSQNSHNNPFFETIRLVHSIHTGSLNRRERLSTVIYPTFSVATGIFTSSLISNIVDYCFSESWYASTRIGVSSLLLGGIITHINFNMGVKLSLFVNKHLNLEEFSRRTYYSIAGGSFYSFWMIKNIFWEEKVGSSLYAISALFLFLVMSKSSQFSKKILNKEGKVFQVDHPTLIGFGASCFQVLLISTVRSVQLSTSI